MLEGAWRRETIFVIVKVFIDEWGTDGRSNFMLLGGLVAKLSQWDRFDRRWRKALRRPHNLDYFHASEFRESKPHFRKLKIDDKVTLATKLAGITDHTLFRFVIHSDNAVFQNEYRARAPSKPSPDSQFGFCFRACLSAVPEMALEACGNPNARIFFIVGDGHRNAGAAPSLWKLVKDNVPDLAQNLMECTLAPMRRYPGLQGADLLLDLYGPDERDGPPELVQVDPTGGFAAYKDSVEYKSPLVRLELTKQAIDELFANKIAYRAFEQRKHELRKARSAATKKASSSESGGSDLLHRTVERLGIDAGALSGLYEALFLRFLVLWAGLLCGHGQSLT